MAVMHFEVPILMLDDDGHLFRKPLDQIVGDLHARRAGAEGEVEMMFARQAVAVAALAQGFADDAAHGCLGECFVADIVSHGRAVSPGLSWSFLRGLQ